MKKKFAAVLFDMDGVLVDSMPYHYISWFEVLKEYGIRISHDEVYASEGFKAEIVTQTYFANHGMKISKEEQMKALAKKRAVFKKYFKNTLFDDAVKLIKALKNQSYIVGLVTGSGSSVVKSVLPKAVFNLFDTVITSDMLKRGKPFPDPYLQAAKNLKISPKDCLVIENAPNGIQSAKAAKMTCFAIETSLPKKYLSKADKIFKDHKELLKYWRNK